MATRTITETDCDRCKKKNVPIKEISIRISPIQIGGEVNQCGIAFDLCIDCLHSILKSYYIKDTTFYEKRGDKLLEIWKIDPGDVRRW